MHVIKNLISFCLEFSEQIIKLCYLSRNRLNTTQFMPPVRKRWSTTLQGSQLFSTPQNESKASIKGTNWRFLLLRDILISELLRLAKSMLILRFMSGMPRVWRRLRFSIQLILGAYFISSFLQMARNSSRLAWIELLAFRSSIGSRREVCALETLAITQSSESSSLLMMITDFTHADINILLNGLWLAHTYLVSSLQTSGVFQVEAHLKTCK